jgi:hypothetical protein
VLPSASLASTPAWQIAGAHQQPSALPLSAGTKRALAALNLPDSSRVVKSCFWREHTAESPTNKAASGFGARIQRIGTATARNSPSLGECIESADRVLRSADGGDLARRIR